MLLHDAFGNYVVQQMIEHGNDEQAGTSPLPINPVIGSMARGTQRLSCSMGGSMGRALNDSAVGCRVLWNHLPELGEDCPP